LKLKENINKNTDEYIKDSQRERYNMNQKINQNIELNNEKYNSNNNNYATNKTSNYATNKTSNGMPQSSTITNNNSNLN